MKLNLLASCTIASLFLFTGSCTVDKGGAELSTNGEPRSTPHSRMLVEQARPALPISRVRAMRRHGSHLVADLPELSKRTVLHPALVELPASSEQAFRLTDVDTGLWIEVTLRGARKSDAELVEGYVVYPGALGKGLLHRVHAEGTEDYVVLDDPPPGQQLQYRVALGDKVAGLRLVANTLEFLDAEGTPRLRMASPVARDASAVMHSLPVSLTGCAYDTDPRGPWERPVTAAGSRDCSVALGLPAGNTTYPLVVDPSWVAAGAMITHPAAPAANLLSTGKVLVSGGHSASSWEDHKATQLFDPATSTWAATGSLIAEKPSPTGTTLNDGRVLVIDTTAELYSPVSATWSTTAIPTSPVRTGHTATLLPNGSVLVAGGKENNGKTDSTTLFSPSSNTWSPGPDMNVARQGHTATLLKNGKVLACGENVILAFHNACDLYDSYSSSWHSTSDMLSARSDFSAALLPDGRVLMIGGHDPLNSNTTYDTTEVYDPSNSKWSSGPKMTDKRTHSPTAILPSGDLLIPGGNLSGLNAELLVVSTFTFQSAGTMLHSGTTATLLPTGNVLVTGSDAQLYSLSGLGTACTANNQCASGLCESGICCDTQCSGLCVACTAAKKGAPPDGICGPIADGTDPDNECPTVGLSSCQSDGVCNGNGACRPLSLGSVCNPATCAGPATVVNASTCNDQGNCQPNGNSDCNPYTCSNGVCLSTCSTPDDCVSPNQCVAGKCGDGKEAGQSCSSDSECKSTFCVESVCCNNACTDPCMTCRAINKESGDEGECGPVTAGKDPKNGCDKSTAACGADGTCDGQGQCRAYAVGGLPCGATPTTCSGGTVSGQVCDGNGLCHEANNVSCKGYKCDADGIACMKSCSTKEDCADGYFCKDASCILVLDNGNPCNDKSWCKSGFCVDAVCCESECKGNCKSCNGNANKSGADGKCDVVKDGTDPREMCPKGSTACGPEGLCGADGECRQFAAAGMQCGAATCDNAVAESKACDGFGLCATQTTPCAPYACDSTTKTCKKECATNADCASGAECDKNKKQCATASNKCKDDFTVVSSGGTATPCTPYRCSAGACRDSCSTSNDCAQGYNCTGAKCVLASGADAGNADSGDTPSATDAGEDSGCGCRAAGRSSTAFSGLLAAVTALALARLRSKRNRSSLQRF